MATDTITQDQIYVSKNYTPSIGSKSLDSSPTLDSSASSENSPRDIQGELLFFPNPENVMLLMHYIRSCENTIRICVYHLTNKPMAQLLLDLYRRGVSVQIITESTTLEKTGSNSFLRLLLEQSNNQITIKLAQPMNKKEGLMHCKYFIIDDEIIGFGSLNWTKQAMMHNHEVLMISRDKKSIKEFIQHFYTLHWMGKKITLIGQQITVDQTFECPITSLPIIYLPQTYGDQVIISQEIIHRETRLQTPSPYVSEQPSHSFYLAQSYVAQNNLALINKIEMALKIFENNETQEKSILAVLNSQIDNEMPLFNEMGQNFIIDEMQNDQTELNKLELSISTLVMENNKELINYGEQGFKTLETDNTDPYQNNNKVPLVMDREEISLDKALLENNLGGMEEYKIEGIENNNNLQKYIELTLKPIEQENCEFVIDFSVQLKSQIKYYNQMTAQENLQSLTQKIKEAVSLSLKFPSKEELLFLEKQPGTQQLVKRANIQLVSLLSDLSKFAQGQTSISKTSLTLPFKSIESVLDDTMERVGLQLDKLEYQEEDDTQGFQTVNDTRNKLQKVEDTQPPKPPQVYGFQHIVENNLGPYPFIPLIKTKLFAIKDIDQEIIDAQKSAQIFFKKVEEDGQDISEFDFFHPYEHEINNLELPADLVDPNEQIQSFSALGQATYVNDKDSLIKMIEHIEELAQINGRTEIAVDLEHFHQRSYLGLTCLIQVSTRGQKDYLIDPFPLWSELHNLGRVMHNPNIIKVLHGADSDVLWLQRDFGVYIVGLFDTFHASKLLQLPSNSFAYLLEYYCLKHTDKTFQLADWTTRPLTENMIKYAQMDTHYLLYIYDRLKIDLYNLAIQRNIQPTSAFIFSAFQKSKDTSLRIFRKPSTKASVLLDNILSRAQKTLDPERYDLTIRLLRWREDIARENDENAKIILPNQALFKILDVKPTKLRDLYAVTGGERGTHFIIKKHHSDIIRICMAESIESIFPNILKVDQPLRIAPTKKPQISDVQTPEENHYDYIHYNYTPFEIEVNNHQSNSKSKVLKTFSLNKNQLYTSLEQSFTFSNSLEIFKHTEIGQILIQNLLNPKQIYQTYNNQTMQEESMNQGQQPKTDDYIAFPQEVGEKPKQKQQSVKLYDETPKSLESQYGTSVSKKRRPKDQTSENIVKKSNKSFNVFNNLQQ